MNIQTGMYIENRYEVLGKIGAGGMSDVFKARDHKLNRFVAIKFLKPEFSEDKNFVKNFQIEAQSAAALLHPNVVGVYDVNQTDDGIYYIVMEYVDGITLKKYIERNGRLPVKEATSIAIQVAQGIDAAHNANIVHRDIKPQNVLISREGKIKVTDFGIARTTTANTISTDILGSVQYISPEQARGGQVDARTDIYSFGIVYYEMITGRLPFDGDSTVAIALKHIQENVPRAGDIVDGVPSSVSRIIEKCTQRKPDRRYQKTSSLLADLKTSLITPNEDFVVLEPEPSESATIIMSGADAELLRREGSKALTKSGQRTSQKTYQDRNRRKYSDSPVRKNDYDRYEYRDYHRQGGNARYQQPPVRSGRKPPQKNDGRKKSDRVLLICGIIAIAIIVALLAIVCVHTFKKGGCSGRSLQVETETETVTLMGVDVPSVIGMEVAKAQSQLENLGFVVKVRYSHSDSIAKEYVIEQSVKNGINLETGEEITLTVSSGQETVLLPDFSGQNVSTVLAALDKMGFSTVVEEKYDDKAEAQLVIETNPVGGSEVAPESEIKVYVSLGPEKIMVTVPDVSWYTESGAIELLNAYSLYSYTTYEESGTMAGYVMNQWPAAGTEVEEWSGVSLVVGIEPSTYEVYEEDTQEYFEPDTQEPYIPPEDETPEYQEEQDTEAITEPEPATEPQTEPELVTEPQTEPADIQGEGTGDAAADEQQSQEEDTWFNGPMTPGTANPDW